MISFRGELSKEAKKFIRKKHKKAGIILSVIGSIIFAIPVILLGILWNPLAYIFFVVVACIPFLTIVGWSFEWDYLTQIDFENGQFYVYFTKKNDTQQTYGGARDFEDVKSVVDYGDFYYIEICGKASAYVCQKDLLVEGSIEQFEEMFADRLVRKK